MGVGWLNADSFPSVCLGFSPTGGGADWEDATEASPRNTVGGYHKRPPLIPADPWDNLGFQTPSLLEELFQDLEGTALDAKHYSEASLLPHSKNLVKSLFSNDLTVYSSLPPTPLIQGEYIPKSGGCLKPEILWDPIYAMCFPI